MTYRVENGAIVYETKERELHHKLSDYLWNESIDWYHNLDVDDTDVLSVIFDYHETIVDEMDNHINTLLGYGYNGPG